MDGLDFLSFAQTLAAQTTQVAWRSAVSRAYDAVFHVARKLLTEFGFQVPRAEHAHSYLWLRLSNCGQPTTIKAGESLSELRQQRNQADYDLHYSFSQLTTQRAVHRAEVAIRILQTAQAEPVRNQIIDAMRTYERDVLRDVTWRP